MKDILFLFVLMAATVFGTMFIRFPASVEAAKRKAEDDSSTTESHDAVYLDPASSATAGNSRRHRRQVDDTVVRPVDNVVRALVPATSATSATPAEDGRSARQRAVQQAAWEAARTKPKKPRKPRNPRAPTPVVPPEEFAQEDVAGMPDDAVF